MADELNKKKPDLGAGVSSPAPSPAPKANPNPAPKVSVPKQVSPQAKPVSNSNSERGFNVPNKLKSTPSNNSANVFDDYNKQKKVFDLPSTKSASQATHKYVKKQTNIPAEGKLKKQDQSRKEEVKKNDLKYIADRMSSNNGQISDKDFDEVIRLSQDYGITEQDLKDVFGDYASQFYSENTPNPAPKVDPVRQKIIDQGFAPKDWKKSAIDDIDKLGSTNVGTGNGKAVDAYKHNNKFYARTYADKEGGAPSEDDMSDISFKGADGNDIDGFDTFEELMEALHKDGYPVDDQLRGQPQSEKIYTDSHGVEWKKNPDKGDGKNYGYSRVDDPNITSNIPADTGANPEEGWDAEPMNEENKRLLNEIPDVDEQQPAWNKENDPGSGVVTKELTDWVRDYLTNKVGKEYADTVASNLARDHNVADFYKGKMKEAYEREQASELYKMDLNKN